VDHEATWVARLARLTGREIVNLGMPGQGPHQYTRILKKYGAPLRPKVIFYAIFSNDLKDGVRFEAPPAERRRKMTPKRFMKRYSTSYNLFSHLSRSLKRKSKDERAQTAGLKLLERRLRDPYGIPDARFASAWAALARQVDDAVAESKRLDARFILLYFPQKEEVYWELAKERVGDVDAFKERVSRLRNQILDFCAARELLCLDLTPVLKSRGLHGEELYYPVDIHWNARGNAVVAQEIYRFLTEKKVIEGGAIAAAPIPE
jgi:hypothetical protein